MDAVSPRAGLGIASDVERLTYSRMRAYRKCARFERLAYVDGWRPVEESEALSFGRIWHVAMEAWWLSCRSGGAPDVDAALRVVAGRARDAWTQIRAEELLRGYHARWDDETVDTLTVIGVEETFAAPLINPSTMQPSRTWRLAGRIDARAETRSGRCLVVEHKTTTEDISPAADYWLRLQMDHQLSIYTLGAESLGWSPSGCLYDVVVRPSQRPQKATPVEARKHTRDGRLYANQRDADETADEYRVRLRAAIEADPARYFQRREVPRTESQIADFCADAWVQAKSMRDAHRFGRAPRNPEACHQYGVCPYWLCCSTGSDPSDYPATYVRLVDVHPELTE